VVFPSPPAPHGVTGADVGALIAAAVPCALIGYMESLSIATTVGRRFGPYDVEPGAELVAVGVANLAVGLTGGYPVTGSFSRTAVNAASGNRSGLSALLSSLWIAVILLALLPALAWVPSLALSSVIAGARTPRTPPCTRAPSSPSSSRRCPSACSWASWRRCSRRCSRGERRKGAPGRGVRRAGFPVGRVHHPSPAIGAPPTTRHPAAACASSPSSRATAGCRRPLRPRP
jgi:hypothetical protein